MSEMSDGLRLLAGAVAVLAGIGGAAAVLFLVLQAVGGAVREVKDLDPSASLDYED